VELFAEVITHAYARDADGDTFESGETVVKRALSQAEWVNGCKRYTIKALLPGDEGNGTLRVYAGRRGMMHSITDNPHPLALSLPILHQGINPPYEFLTRHPTPHAQRHDLYVAQPQCRTLSCNNTFVFAVRQHPSSLAGAPPAGAGAGAGRAPSPLPFLRPGSAMSTTSSSASGGGTGNPTQPGQLQKPAKLAVQSPGGKILRLTRKSGEGIDTDGGTWEAFIKVGERGTWRGLVLADRSARWCVFGEWDCD
jgi:transglutaminase/protease-like cytokinesis protein 3